MIFLQLEWLERCWLMETITNPQVRMCNLSFTACPAASYLVVVVVVGQPLLVPQLYIVYYVQAGIQASGTSSLYQAEHFCTNS